jgi:hypothetical protein
VPSRIDVELTSSRPDGTWTWRAAGAREPRGVVEASVLPSGAKVGDVFKVEATIALDGIEIHSVVPQRTARKQTDRLEILGGGDFEAVTTSLVGRRDRGDRGRRDRRDDSRGRDRKDGDRPRDDRRRTERPRGEGGGGAQTGAERAPRDRPPRRERPSYAPVPEVPQRPKPKRLRPGRAHRQALLVALPDEQKPVAEQLLRGGIPSVRQALREQNDALRAEGKPEVKTSGLETLAQDLLPQVRVAEWLDRADAAQASVDDLDLRDLRSVVTAAADPMVARDDSTRELADALREALERRQNEEHEQWLGDITAALDVGRVVRALRLSSRPPKAGVPFPPEMGTRLAEAATASLTADAASDRWAAVVEALAFSPVHAVVAPPAPPQQVSDELLALVKGVAGSVPQIALLLGIEPPPPGSRAARPPRLPRRPPRPKAPARTPPATGSKSPVPPAPPPPEPEPESSSASATYTETPAVVPPPSEAVEVPSPEASEQPEPSEEPEATAPPPEVEPEPDVEVEVEVEEVRAADGGPSDAEAVAEPEAAETTGEDVEPPAG